MTGEGVAGEVRRRSVSANLVALCLLLTLTALGFWLGQAMPSANVTDEQARFATGVMGAVLGSMVGSVLSTSLMGIARLLRQSRLLQEAQETRQKFEGYLQTHKDFELAMEPLHVTGARWALKAAGNPLGMFTDFEADVFRHLLAERAIPYTLVERSVSEVIVTRMMRGVRHHATDWAMRIYTLGSRQDGADYRDYFFVRGRPVRREQLEELAAAAIAEEEAQPRARPRDASRPTDALPRIPKLPGVTRSTDALAV